MDKRDGRFIGPDCGALESREATARVLRGRAGRVDPVPREVGPAGPGGGPAGSEGTQVRTSPPTSLTPPALRSDVPSGVKVSDSTQNRRPSSRAACLPEAVSQRITSPPLWSAV